MVTYGVLIWAIIGAFMLGGSFGLALSSLMVMAKDKIEVRKEGKNDDREKM